jgi:hypothetical protein
MEEGINLTNEDISLLILAVKSQDKNDSRYRVLLEKLYDIAMMEDIEDSE